MWSESAGGTEDVPPSPVFRDIRRYFCDFCGICRSKKSLITAHIMAHHQEEAGCMKYDAGGGDENKHSEYTCTECGVSFKKPAYLRQHMQGHSLERPFVCPVDDCHRSYRRKDHLTRHLLQHEGKIFVCPVGGCGRRFTLQGNMRRHVKEFHNEEGCSCRGQSQQQHICPEEGCGKVFRYLSKLKKHMDSHVKLDYVDVICGEPGCMKHFTNAECLRAHVRTCHRHVQCPTCGTQQLRKNLKRHMRLHESQTAAEKIKCHFPGCLHAFSKKSNLDKHIRVVHLECRPFLCRFAGCGLKFPYKHVRDNHEKSGAHTYFEGDFLVSDEQFRSRPRGGRKRKHVGPVESLLRKRIAAAPDEIGPFRNATHYHLHRLLGGAD